MQCTAAVCATTSGSLLVMRLEAPPSLASVRSHLCCCTCPPTERWVDGTLPCRPCYYPWGFFAGLPPPWEPGSLTTPQGVRCNPFAALAAGQHAGALPPALRRHWCVAVVVIVACGIWGTRGCHPTGCPTMPGWA